MYIHILERFNSRKNVKIHLKSLKFQAQQNQTVKFQVKVQIVMPGCPDVTQGTKNHPNYPSTTTSLNNSTSNKNKLHHTELILNVNVGDRIWILQGKKNCVYHNKGFLFQKMGFTKLIFFVIQLSQVSSINSSRIFSNHWSVYSLVQVQLT